LRREEVAAAADVGVTWYTWLEQGRDIRVSRDALGRIDHALRLSPSDTAYLVTLATAEDGPAKAPPEPDARIVLAVRSCDLVPSWAVDPLFNVVAFNRLADLIYRFDEVKGPFARNHLWRLFADPKRGQLYGESKPLVARSGVGLLRANYAAHAGSHEFDSLLTALHEFPDFVRLWEAQYTAPTSQTLIGHFYREDLGRLNVFSLRLLLPDLPGCLIFVLPPADEPTRVALRRLGRRKSRALA
jgi:hypothetical protein